LHLGFIGFWDNEIEYQEICWLKATGLLHIAAGLMVQVIGSVGLDEKNRLG
jgi:hypothetical protein